MKGLLIKDFKLMKNQKNYFLFILAIGIGITAFMEASSFIIGYVTYVGTFFTLSTISYDEFDNGNAFLFSLPITRKDYIIEKYEFGLIVSGASWLLAAVISVTAEAMRGSILAKDTIMIAFMFLPALLIMLAIMLPFHLKFGGEKGRTAILGAVGLLFVVGIIVVKIAEVFHIDLISAFNHLPTMSMGMLIAAALGITIIALLLSLKVSIAIMHKKEF